MRTLPIIVYMWHELTKVQQRQDQNKTPPRRMVVMPMICEHDPEKIEITAKNVKSHIDAGI
jgi:hypothetical protein